MDGKGRLKERKSTEKAEDLPKKDKKVASRSVDTN
jgi:hypothetical protein